jgi:2-dehydro-3-deoxy-L-rhamnonate dehydrogenase (NAD+)
MAIDRLIDRMTQTPEHDSSGWSGQCALITGGANGFGSAVAKRLASRGIRLVLLDSNPAALERAAASLGAETIVAQADVTDSLAVKSAVDEAAAKTGRLDILVNCAGITGRTNIKSHEVDLADFERVMRVNVNSCLHTFEAVVPHMLPRNYGGVLHFASIVGKEGNAGMLAYSTSKAAMERVRRASSTKQTIRDLRSSAPPLPQSSRPSLP